MKITIFQMYKIYLRLLFFLIVRSLSAGEIAITFDDAPLPGSEFMNGKEKTIENGVDMTNVVIKGTGEVTKEELEEKPEKMLLKQGINKEKTKLNVEVSIES